MGDKSVPNRDWSGADRKENVNGKRTTQLFDIDKDPMETNDLSKEPSSSKLIDVLREKLLEGKKEYGDNIAPYSSFWEGF